MKTKVSKGLIGIFLVGIIFSFTEAITSTVPWLRWGSSARLLATGESGSAIVKDATALFWNPAGLAYVSSPQLSACGMKTPAAAYGYLYFSYAHPMNLFGIEGTMGESLYYMQMDSHLTPDLERCRELIEQGRDYRIGTIYYMDSCVTLGFGWKLRERLLAGVNLKIIYSTTWNRYFGAERRVGLKEHYPAFSFAFDFGLAYRVFDEFKVISNFWSLKNLTLSLVIKNIGPDLRRESCTTPGKFGSDPLPHQLVLGLGCELYEQGNHRLTFTIDPYLLVGRTLRAIDHTYVEWHPKYFRKDGKVIYNKYAKIKWDGKQNKKGWITYEEFNQLQEERGERGWPTEEWVERTSAHYSKNDDPKEVRLTENPTLLDPGEGETGEAAIQAWEKEHNAKLVKPPEICIATTVTSRDALVDVNLGLEYCFADIISFRVGRMARLSEPMGIKSTFQNSFTFGVGIKIKKYAFDYAYLPWGEGTMKTHIGTLTIHWGG